jgi:hypothetical protein
VSTLTLPAGQFSSQIEGFERAAKGEYLSDDEIEKAITEIRIAINKASKVG